MRSPFKEEEDQDEQRQHHPCREVPGRASERQRPAEDAAAVVLQGGRCFLDVLVNLRGGQVQRPLGQPVLDLLDSGQRLAPQLLESQRQLPPHERQRPGDQPDEGKHRERQRLPRSEDADSAATLSPG